jgi:hypothetical protein
MDKQMKKRSIAALIAAPVMLVAAGGTALAATSSTPAPPSNLYGCVSGASRTLEGVYTVAGNFKACKDGFPFTVASGAPGRTGATGPQGPAGTPTLYESTVTDAPDVQLDMAPGPDGKSGSSGWGVSSAGIGLTNLKAGSTSTFTVTVLQPNSESADGSITLSWNPFDFTFVSNADGTCSAVPNTSAETCAFTDLAHSAKGVGFQFKANQADPDAVIGVTTIVDGEEASGTFPVQITG